MSNLNAGNWDSGNMFGWLEESLNYVNRVYLPDPQGEGFQLDLLIPEKGAIHESIRDSEGKNS